MVSICSPRYATASSGGDTARTRRVRAHAAPPPASAALLHVLPEALRTSCLSALFIGGAIAVFSALSSVLTALGAVEALQRTLLFLLPPEAVPALLAGALEVSNGCRLAASCALSLPVRASMLCALCAFGGLSVFCQAQVFLDGLAPARTYLLGRLTHAGLSFALCRAVFLFFGSSLPTFAAQEAAASLAPGNSPCGADAAPVPGLFPAALEAAPAPALRGNAKGRGLLPFPDRCCASIFRRGPRYCRPRRL